MTDVRTSKEQFRTHLTPVTPMPTEELEHQASLTDWLSLNGEEEYCNHGLSNWNNEVSNQVTPACLRCTAAL